MEVLANTSYNAGLANVSSPSSENMLPAIDELEKNLMESSNLVDNIVLKKYLHNLTDLEVIPIDDNLKRIDKIRLFKITEMVYQKDEYSTYKFASVFSAVQNLNCGIFVMADSDGEKTEFYMGVRSLDDKRTTNSLKETLKNALVGQFPGVKCLDLLDPEAQKVLDEISYRNITSVSCVANNKDDDFKDNKTFIQGLEKLALSMQGQKYTAIILAKSTTARQIDVMRRAYETIYTQLSPFANMQLSYGTNTAQSMTDAFSYGTTKGTSYTRNISDTHTTGTSDTDSVSKTNTAVKAIGSAILGIASIAAAPLTGGASLVAAGAIMAGQVGLNAYNPPTVTRSRTTNVSDAHSEGESSGENESSSETKTLTRGETKGETKNMQLTMQNKALLNTLEKIDLQLKRLEECEGLGMWECATYFLSDTQETAEMAAGTYKALMKGSRSGVESSAVNYWGDKAKCKALQSYITNFIHPVFAYNTSNGCVPVSTSSFLSSNELAIQMGLPRKAVCGFPVIEHADFGKEVVTNGGIKKFGLPLGKVFSMGAVTKTNVTLDIDSLTMHTFVTGSTGSGKSNTVYEILNQLYNVRRIPFLVVEPAKGEYKNIFGQYSDVCVYGSNPKKSKLLKINPFKFPRDIHVLEHLDRLVEIFNVCWPMYAAMPAILKEAIERAYVSVGWDLTISVNSKGEKYPNFSDVFEQIESVINESKYSSDSKGDYSGALLTRVRSLTNGLNGLIFCDDDLTDEELFDKSVIVDLSRIGSIETKALIMGLLIMKLNEYRMSLGKMNSGLSHITVLEEAHNLLKRTSAEQSSESSNLLGKSVELLANSIAEMRTYGEGFIIADQSPGLLDMSVIRNTNTKIILRLPEKSDRELVGYAACLNDSQIDELSKLKRGVAAVYQNDWIEPVLVQVNKCDIIETPFAFVADISQMEKKIITEQVVNFLLQGRVQEQLDFSINEVEESIGKLSLTSRDCETIEELIADFKENGCVECSFSLLAHTITRILNTREKVKEFVLCANDYQELTSKLDDLILGIFPNASADKRLALSHCFMKDMSTQSGEDDTRKAIYATWVKHIRERV